MGARRVPPPFGTTVPVNVAPIFRGRVEAGKVKLDHRDEFAALVKRLDGKEIELTLRRHHRQRSPSQNRYLHGCVIPILAKHCGYDDEEMKTALKLRFLRDGDGEVNGLPRVRSTADLTTAEMTEFIDRIRQLAAEMGCSIPSPNEVAL
jgi:hypothetical protein